MALPDIPRSCSRFLLTPLHPFCEPVGIVARDEAAAWRKFCVQRFGVLKPARSEWRIEVIATRASHDRA